KQEAPLRLNYPTRPRQAALAAAAGAAAIACLISSPSRGQQAAPALHLAAPAAASPAPDTRVSADFTLPPGVKLELNPRLRITDPKGQLFELLPMQLVPGAGATAAFRDVLTELYPPGAYKVQLEILYAPPGGKTVTATTAATTMTVPAW